jgi:hypothetical protein
MRAAAVPSAQWAFAQLAFTRLALARWLFAALACTAFNAQAASNAPERCSRNFAQGAVGRVEGLPATQVTEARWFTEGNTEEAGAASAGRAPLPAHCRVEGVIGAHTGAPGTTAYGNRFRLRLPANWNGRFVFQGGGGNNGVVGDALGALKDGQLALAQGYAVAAQDSGHSGRAPHFALDRQAYEDFAHAGVHNVAVASKAIVAAITGEAPKRAYFVGCSNGGREAMVSAQRHADFDGVVAGAPGYAVYEQWLQNLHALRVVSRVAGVPPGTIPKDTSAAYTDAQLQAVHAHFMQQCDARDGLVDGLISRPAACTATAADYRALQCAAAGGESTSAQCLSPLQLEGLQALYDGARDSQGRLLWPGFAPGGIELGLRGPYLGTPGSPNPVGAFYEGVMANFPFMAYGFRGYTDIRGPADELASYPANSLAYVAQFNFDTEPQKLVQGRLDFQAGNIDPNAAGPNYEAFRQRGGKMLMYTGLADSGVQPRGVAQFMDRLRAHYTSAVADDMAALFMVPGMQHCRGGAATELFDQLAPLVAWVEQGQRPARIVARAVPGGALDRALPGITRPLCAYPAYARYSDKMNKSKSADPANAESFVCTTD